MIPKHLKYLTPFTLSFIITCVVFISCGDEGELIKDELSSAQQPLPGEPILEPSSQQQTQPIEQVPQPPEPLQPELPQVEQTPQPLEQPQPEPPQVEQMPQPEPEPEPLAVLPGLPDDIAGYDRWLKLNAQPIPPVAGGDPHRGTKNVYVNQTREAIAPNGEQQFPYPDGAIVVKEATRPGKDFIGLVAVMWKEAGSNPDFGDWRFEEFLRNASDAEFRLAFEGAVCTGCHSGAAATDFVFVTLE